MPSAVRQHVLHRRAEVVAHVVSEKGQHALEIGAGHESALENVDPAVLVDPGQTQSGEFLEQRARMDIPGDQVRKALEARGRPLQGQRDRRAIRIVQCRIGQPASKGLGGRRRTRRGGAIAPLHQAGDFATVQAGGSAVAADGPMRRHSSVGGTSGLDIALLERLDCVCE